MRFVLAIVLFVCALASAGLGIAQRTVLAGPSSFETTAKVSASAPLTVIDGRAMTALPGTQSLTVRGSDTVFVAYGRTADVRAWVGSARYNSFSRSAKKQELVGRTVAGSEQRVPSPRDSDLWLDQKSASRSLDWTLGLSSDYSILIASDGKTAAPADVRVRWPVDNSAPYSGALIAGGIGLLILGLLAFVWALVHTRRTRGPRRRQPRLPRAPTPKAISPRSQRALAAGPARGRRRGFTAIPLVIGGALVLSGCTGANLGIPAASTTSPSASPTDAAKAAGLPPVAVTKSQLAQIVARVSATVAAADSALDATRASERLDGPALAERQANYTIRKADGAQPAERSIPPRSVQLLLPQQNAKWPRTVFAVVGDTSDAKTAPTGLMLVQQNPRSQYKAQYVVALEANVKTPALAPADVGAPRVSPTVPYLALRPDRVGAAYYDLLVNGDKSTEPTAKLFDTESDQLFKDFGPKYRADRAAAIPASAQLAFTRAAGAGSTVVFSTNNTGAIIATDVADVETVTPKEAGSAINPTGQVKLLSGVTQTTKGVVSTYGLQLLMYVPPSGSSQKIRVLGYATGLISSKEAP